MNGWTALDVPDGCPPLWRTQRRGPAVVALHGIEDGAHNWQALADLLPDRTVYAAQLPWHSGNDYTWRARHSPAEALARILDAVDEPEVLLLGHSFGANAILAWLAGQPPRPERISAAVLVAPFYRPRDFALTPSLHARSLAAFRRVIGHGLALSQGPRAARIDPEIRAGMALKVLDRVVPCGFPVFLAEFEASGHLDLSRVAVPTLVLAGTADEGLTPMRAAALAAAMPVARVRLRPGLGHFCHVDDAERVVAEIRGFLAAAGDESAEERGDTVIDLLDGQPTSYVGRPRYEGANIRTWIGFKHFMYLAEEAVLQYFRDRGAGARDMFHRYGLGLEVVDSSMQLPVALEAEEQVYATVVSGRAKPGAGAPLTVELTVERDGQNLTVAKAKIRVALVQLKDVPAAEPVPAFLEPFVVPEAAAVAGSAAREPLTVPPGADAAAVLTPPGSPSYLWSWRAPYYYCHFSDRLQHSAYIRTLEEVVDRYLAHRGLAVGHLLVERGWIPVVSKARVQLLADIFMEETVHTVFTVEDILRDTMWSARMDCYVQRGDQLVLAATGTIMHGYAISRGPDAGTVAVLDDATQAALLGGAA